RLLPSRSTRSSNASSSNGADRAGFAPARTLRSSWNAFRNNDDGENQRRRELVSGIAASSWGATNETKGHTQPKHRFRLFGNLVSFLLADAKSPRSAAMSAGAWPSTAARQKASQVRVSNSPRTSSRAR